MVTSIHLANNSASYAGNLTADTVLDGAAAKWVDMAFAQAPSVSQYADFSTSFLAALPPYPRGWGSHVLLAGPPDAPVVIHGQVFPVGTKVEEANNGELLIVELPVDMTYKGIPCRMGRLRIHNSSGMPDSCHLSADIEIQGVPCRQGGYVSFYKSGKLLSGYLSADTEMQGIPCGKVYDVEFYESGKIASCGLSKDTVMQGVPLTGVRSTPRSFDLPIISGVKVEFYESGNIKSGRLAEDKVIQGIPFLRGTTVNFHDSGRLAVSRYPGHIVVQGISFMHGASITFHENGKIKNGGLSNDTAINGVSFARLWETRIDASRPPIYTGASVTFYDNGKVKTGRLSRTQVVQGIPLDDTVLFYESGQVKAGGLSERKEMQGIIFASGTSFALYENGKLRKVRLREDTDIAGTEYSADKIISFDADGAVVGVEDGYKMNRGIKEYLPDGIWE